MPGTVLSPSGRKSKVSWLARLLWKLPELGLRSPKLPAGTLCSGEAWFTFPSADWVLMIGWLGRGPASLIVGLMGSMPMSGATWLGGPKCLCWYGRFGMSSGALWDWSGLGSRLIPEVTCLLAEPQPMLRWVIKPPCPGPGVPPEWNSDAVLPCCTLFIPKEFPCAFGPKKCGLFWLSPIRFWLLCCWNWPIHELGRQLFPTLNLWSDGVELIFGAEALVRWHDTDCRSLSGPLLVGCVEVWPVDSHRLQSDWIHRVWRVCLIIIFIN